MPSFCAAASEAKCKICCPRRPFRRREPLVTWPGPRRRHAPRASRRTASVVRRLACSADDGYASELVSACATADAARLADELAFAAARRPAAQRPAWLYADAALAADPEEAAWLCLLIAYLQPLESDDPWASIAWPASRGRPRRAAEPRRQVGPREACQPPPRGAECSLAIAPTPRWIADRRVCRRRRAGVDTLQQVAIRSCIRRLAAGSPRAAALRLPEVRGAGHVDLAPSSRLPRAGWTRPLSPPSAGSASATRSTSSGARRATSLGRGRRRDRRARPSRSHNCSRQPEVARP
jgi:hypothetical protein